MEQEKVLLTQSGLEKLEQERDRLINVERPKVIEELQLARSQGDLSENADYDAAREKQAHLESRIKEIDYMLQNAEIISEDQMDLKVVKPGTTVTILDLSETDAEPESYKIVGFTETDPLNGKISNESPLAKAVIGHGVNEVVTVGVAEPYDVKILKSQLGDRIAFNESSYYGMNVIEYAKEEKNSIKAAAELRALVEEIKEILSDGDN